MRIPPNAENVSLTVNDQSVPVKLNDEGYAMLDRVWETGDVIGMKFDMPVRFVRSNPLVREAVGQVAVQRGPFIYCAEEVDNGPNLHLLRLDPTASAIVEKAGDLGHGIMRIKIKGTRVLVESERSLYSSDPYRTEECTITLVPYFAWNNRRAG